MPDDQAAGCQPPLSSRRRRWPKTARCAGKSRKSPRSKSVRGSVLPGLWPAEGRGVGRGAVAAEDRPSG